MERAGKLSKARSLIQPMLALSQQTVYESKRSKNEHSATTSNTTTIDKVLQSSIALVAADLELAVYKKVMRRADQMEEKQKAHAHAQMSCAPRTAAESAKEKEVAGEIAKAVEARRAQARIHLSRSGTLYVRASVWPNRVALTRGAYVLRMCGRVAEAEVLARRGFRLTISEMVVCGKHLRFASAQMSSTVANVLIMSDMKRATKPRRLLPLAWVRAARDQYVEDDGYCSHVHAHWSAVMYNFYLTLPGIVVQAGRGAEGEEEEEEMCTHVVLVIEWLTSLAEARLQCRELEEGMNWYLRAIETYKRAPAFARYCNIIMQYVHAFK
jgi:hypothetical protein